MQWRYCMIFGEEQGCAILNGSREIIFLLTIFVLCLQGLIVFCSVFFCWWIHLIERWSQFDTRNLPYQRSEVRILFLGSENLVMQCSLFLLQVHYDISDNSWNLVRQMIAMSPRFDSFEELTLYVNGFCKENETSFEFIISRFDSSEDMKRTFILD